MGTSAKSITVTVWRRLKDGSRKEYDYERNYYVKNKEVFSERDKQEYSLDLKDLANKLKNIKKHKTRNNHIKLKKLIRYIDNEIIKKNTTNEDENDAHIVQNDERQIISMENTEKSHVNGKQNNKRTKKIKKVVKKSYKKNDEESDESSPSTDESDDRSDNKSNDKDDDKDDNKSDNSNVNSGDSE